MSARLLSARRLPHPFWRSALAVAALSATTALALSLTPARVLPVGGGVAHDLLWLSDTEILSTADNRLVVTGAQGSVVRTYLGLSTDLDTVRASPARRWVAGLSTSRSTETVTVWDATTQKIVGQLKGMFLRSAFLAGETLLYSAGDKLTLLDPATGTQRALANPLGEEVLDMVASQNGQRVALRGLEEIVILDASGKPLKTFPASDVLGMAFSGDGTWFATIGEEDAQVYELATGRTRTVEDSAYMDHVGFAGNEGLFLYSSGEVILVELATGETRREELAARSALAMALNSKGDLAIGSYGGLFRPVGDRQVNVSLPGASVYTLGWAAGGFVTLNDQDQLVNEKGQPISEPVKKLGDVASSSTALWLSTSTAVGQLVNGQFKALASLPEGPALQDRLNVTEGAPGAVLWRAATLRVIVPGRAAIVPNLKALADKSVIDGALTSDGKTLNVLQENGVLSEYALSTGQLRRVADLPGEAEALAVSRGGSRAVIHSTGGRFVLSLLPPGATTPKRTLALPGSRYDLGMKFSPDGKSLAVTVGGNSVWLLDTATLNVLAKAGPLAQSTRQLAWSADGRELAVGAGPMDREGGVSIFKLK